MFKVSQEIRLNIGAHGSDGTHSNNHNDNNNGNSDINTNCIFGKYQKSPDAGES